MRTRLLLLPFLAAAISGCGTGEASLRLTNGSVGLHPGQRVALTPDGATLIILDSVYADSRCPASAQCAWAGDAAVALRLTGAGRPDVRWVLQAHGLPKDTTSEGWHVTLDSLTPARPPATQDIAQADYRAFLTIKAAR